MEKFGTYQFELFAQSVSGVHESSELRRYAPPISVRAYASPLTEGLKTIPGTNPPPPTIIHLAAILESNFGILLHTSNSDILP